MFWKPTRTQPRPHQHMPLARTLVASIFSTVKSLLWALLLLLLIVYLGQVVIMVLFFLSFAELWNIASPFCVMVSKHSLQRDFLSVVNLGWTCVAVDTLSFDAALSLDNTSHEGPLVWVWMLYDQRKFRRETSVVWTWKQIEEQRRDEERRDKMTLGEMRHEEKR